MLFVSGTWYRLICKLQEPECRSSAKYIDCRSRAGSKQAGRAARAMAKLEISLTLDQRQLDWLQNMADKYSLPTADKALRIVILFTKRGKEFNQTIFKEIDVPATKNMVSGKHAMDKVHEDYLEEVVTNYKLASKDQAVQIMLDYAIFHIDEKTLFEVKLCKHGDTCKHC